MGIKDNDQNQGDEVRDGTFRPSSPRVELLRREDIGAFRDVIVSGIQGMQFGLQSEREESAAKRTEKYFQDALSNPDFTLLAAKDSKGRVVGGLEAKIVDIGGRKVGHVYWICVDPQNRIGGLGTSLYQEYEKQMRAKGNIYAILAEIANGNTPSLRLHARLGITEVLERKGEKAWYYKNLQPDR